MRILGLDWGEVRIGVAISDPLGITAQPQPYIVNDKHLIPNLKDLVIRYSISSIVLGNPKQMNGQPGISSGKVSLFKDKLIGALGINVLLWDERLTTKMAEKALISSGTSREKRKTIIDSISAGMMLQSYIDSIKK
jgi:putative holliday junction resolvase